MGRAGRRGKRTGRSLEEKIRGSTCSGALHLRLEEVEGGEHEDAGEDKEDQGRPGQPLFGQVLHHEIEGEVHGHVGQEDEEQGGGEVGVKDEQESHAEHSVDGHEDDQKPKPKRKVCIKACNGYTTHILCFDQVNLWYIQFLTYLVFDLSFSFALSLI